MKTRCSHRFPLALLALSTAAFAGCSGDEVPLIKTPRPVVMLPDPAKVDSSYLADTGGTLLIKVGARGRTPWRSRSPERRVTAARDPRYEENHSC